MTISIHLGPLECFAMGVLLGIALAIAAVELGVWLGRRRGELAAERERLASAWRNRK